MVQFLILIFSPLVSLFIFMKNIDKLFSKIFLKLYIYGMLITIPVILFEKILITFAFFNKLTLKLFISFIVSGFTEEFLKRLIVISLTKKPFFYRESSLGIIYSLFVGLGFSSLANFLFIIVNFNSYEMSMMEIFFSNIGNILFAFIMGIYLSLSKVVISNKKRRYYFQMSLLTPIIFHGIYDFIISVEAFILLPFLILLILALFLYYQRKLHYFYEIIGDK